MLKVPQRVHLRLRRTSSLFCNVLSASILVSLNDSLKRHIPIVKSEEDISVFTGNSEGVGHNFLQLDRPVINAHSNVNVENLDHLLNSSSEETIIDKLKALRIKNINKLIIAELNINSVSSKFDQLSLMIQGNIDILVITESKLDDSFPKGQFKIPGYAIPYRKDRNRCGGGVLVFIREDIPSKQLSTHNLPGDIEALLIEINIRKTKFLLLGGYHPPSQSDNYFFDNISRVLDTYRSSYDKILLAGDFNAKITEPCLGNFLDVNDFKCLVKEDTCFKNPSNPSCIDLFLTNFSSSFQNTCALSTGLSDFHKMIVTVQKSTFAKFKPKIIQYRCYKQFDNESFRFELRQRLSNCKNYADFNETYIYLF